ncbi:transmembrane protein, putative [Rhizoctonia solani AG-3 Rhs1AP]|uniref:Transmembrane protein, putative n=2 Tax=Rhizoctonia solani AG-3 TaxID=1086053 RepID=X8JPI8_9AGAM|nr:transmembrane protein, putative [Rhizoctonia solani AG-3 Rhs1AP]KEP52058.1 putative transmembrane protein [Rhizoctonia solani 123E]
MSDAAKARAEARKKAILSGRTNRLAKLTSTARGEEAAAAFIREAEAQEKAQALAQEKAESQAQQNELALPGFRDSNLRDFVGESTPVTSFTPSPDPSRAATPSRVADVSARAREDSGLDSPPPVWTPEQEALLRRIMGGPSGAGSPDAGMTDPLAAMMSMFSSPGGPLGDMLGGMGGTSVDGIPPALKNLGMSSTMPSNIPMMPPMPQPESRLPASKPFLVRWLPLLHIIATVSLCIWFIVFGEPAAFASTHWDESAPVSSSLWSRWAALARREPESLGIHPMPFILVFITLQLILHSLSIFYDSTPTGPTGILGMVVPHLPHPFPSVITHSMKYLKLGGILLDDLSIVIFILGVTVFISSFKAGAY